MLGFGYRFSVACTVQAYLTIVHPLYIPNTHDILVHVLHPYHVLIM